MKFSIKALAFGALALGYIGSLQAQQYIVFEQPMPEGASSTILSGINEWQYISGYSNITVTGFRPYAYYGGWAFDLLLGPGVREATVQSVNDNGDFAGQAFTLDSAEPIIWDWQGNPTRIGLLPGSTQGSAQDINVFSQVVGTCRGAGGANSKAYLWTSGSGFLQLALLAGWPDSLARKINYNSTIVGAARRGPVATAVNQPAMWPTPTTVVDLGQIPGATSGVATDIAGYWDFVVGTSRVSNRDRAWWKYFVNNGGTYDIYTEDLGHLVGMTATWPQGVNNWGEIVGYSETTSSNRRAFCWDFVNGMQNVTTALLHPSQAGWVIEEINDINDSHEMVGMGRFNGGPRVPVLLVLGS